jgi:predicted acylesterase/phospholipase RssA
MENENCYKGSIKDIALSLSGGGVRAVGYHLGTLSMLNRLELLENVEILSSVSGGSLPGLGYAISQRVGRSFQDFFDDFYEFLPHMNTAEELLDRLTGKKAPSPSGRRDLISSMANLYNELYFEKYFQQYSEREDKKLTFGILMDHPEKGHLKEMIFNATEFKSGTAFRFQVSEFRCLIGNADVAICPKHARDIRIADILAASSCIPGGMEPLFFPQDFHWPDDEEHSARRPHPRRKTCDDIQRSLERNLDTKESTVALMDGGIYDNQGMISTLLAINRRKEKVPASGINIECGFSLNSEEPTSPEDQARWMAGRHGNHIHRDDLDLMIISDTPVRKASFYPRITWADIGKEKSLSEKKEQAAREKKEKMWFGILQKVTIRGMDLFLWIFAALLATSAAMTIRDLIISEGYKIHSKGFIDIWRELSYKYLDLFVPISLVVIFAFVLILYSIKRDMLIDKLATSSPKWRNHPREYIRKVRLGDLFNMGELRAGSLSALTSSIFMNRIRGLSYSTVYGREDLHNRIIANEIFALQKHANATTSLEKELAKNGHWPPSDKLLAIVDKAATLETKLWIDSDKKNPFNDLDYLVMCGQATTCYKLMTFMWDHCRDKEGEWLDLDTKAHFERAMRVWTSLYDDPSSMLMNRKRDSRIEKMRDLAKQYDDRKRKAS